MKKELNFPGRKFSRSSISRDGNNTNVQCKTLINDNEKEQLGSRNDRESIERYNDAKAERELALQMHARTKVGWAARGLADRGLRCFALVAVLGLAGPACPVGRGKVGAGVRELVAA